MDKTWILIGAIIIATIGIIAGILFIGNNSNKNNEVITNVIVNDVKANVITNTIVNKNINTIVENTAVENVTKNETTTETFSEKPKTIQEKAILIAKNNYGEGSNIEFSVVQIDDGKGRVVVLVTDANTTQALAYYHVDVENNTFEIQN